MENQKPKSKFILKELSSTTVNSQASSIVLEQDEELEHNDEKIPPVQIQPVEPLRSGSVTRLPARYMLLGETFVVILAKHDQEPRNYEESISLEIEFMYSNKVWTFVESPVGVKPLLCKWIYKKKK